MKPRTRPPALLLALLVALALAGCGGDGEDTATLPTVAPAPETSVPATSVPPSAAPTTRPAFPPAARPLEQGSRAVGVYVAVERSADAPELAAAKDELRRAGYEPGEGYTEVGCDRGAREALGLRPDVDYWATVVYFHSRPEAQQFVDAFVPGVVGTAEVTIFCADSGF